MNAVEITVAALVFLLIGFGLCALGVFCYFMLKMMKGLQESAASVTKVAGETLAEAKTMIAQVKEVSERNFGDNSAVSRASKAVSSLSGNLPEVMAGLKVFNETFSAIYRTTFQPEKVQRAVRTQPSDDESQFIPYDEGQAAQYEEMARAQKERLVLSEEELAGMRTDKVREVPPAVPEEPTGTA